MRAKAFEIQGLKEPSIEVPAPPRLLPISWSAEISWQGSVGASSYDVERSTERDGAWKVVGKQVDDTWVRYRPLFTDNEASAGKSYYYRVRAKNLAGTSVPSNVVGPVRVTDQYLVDEMIDFSQIASREGKLSLETANARPYREDPHRLKGSKGDSIIYRTSDPLHVATVLTLMEGEEKEFEFYVSSDGKTFAKVNPTISRFLSEGNLYGYKLPVKYELADIKGKSTFVKIVFTGDAQISRVELKFGK